MDKLIHWLWLLILCGFSAFMGVLIANIVASCIGLVGFHPRPEFFAGWLACWLFYQLAQRMGHTI